MAAAQAADDADGERACGDIQDEQDAHTRGAVDARARRARERLPAQGLHGHGSLADRHARHAPVPLHTRECEPRLRRQARDEGAARAPRRTRGAGPLLHRGRAAFLEGGNLQQRLPLLPRGDDGQQDSRQAAHRHAREAPAHNVLRRGEKLHVPRLRGAPRARAPNRGKGARKGAARPPPPHQRGARAHLAGARHLETVLTPRRGRARRIGARLCRGGLKFQTFRKT